MSLEEITTRHNTVEAFTTDPDLRERLRDQHMRGQVSQRAGSVAAEPVLATTVLATHQTLNDQALRSQQASTSHGAAEGSSCAAQSIIAVACFSAAPTCRQLAAGMLERLEQLHACSLLCTISMLLHCSGVTNKVCRGQLYA